MKYNVAHATGSEAFDLSVNAAPATWADECSTQKITICTRYKMADGESNMALLEIGMISGYVPDRTSLYSLLEDANTSKHARNYNRYDSLGLHKLLHQIRSIVTTIRNN